jgi:hypothetical protein
MRTQGMRLDQWIDRNREFVSEAFSALPIVNLPCEGGCGRIVVRSCRRDRVVCGGCDFKDRCQKAAEQARAYLGAPATLATPRKPTFRRTSHPFRRHAGRRAA